MWKTSPANRQGAGAPPFSVPLLFLYKKNVFVTPQARDFIEMTKAYYNGLRPPADL